MEKYQRTIFESAWLRPLMRKASALFFWINAWEIIRSVEIPKKCVIAAIPHKTWLDLPYTIMIAFDLNLHIRILAKEELFQNPFGTALAFLGCNPVNRSVHTGAVGLHAKRLAESTVPLQLVIPPEGTRKGVECWKMGFYWIALEAKVPIALFYIDYKNRRVIVGKLLTPTGDVDADMKIVKDFYKQYEVEEE